MSHLFLEPYETFNHISKQSDQSFEFTTQSFELFEWNIFAKHGKPFKLYKLLNLNKKHHNLQSFRYIHTSISCKTNLVLLFRDLFTMMDYILTSVGNHNFFRGEEVLPKSGNWKHICGRVPFYCCSFLGLNIQF